METTDTVPPSSPGALRTRRYNERRRLNLRCLHVEVHPKDIIDGLVDRGYLAPEDRQNPRAIRQALSKFLKDEFKVEECHATRQPGGRQSKERRSPTELAEPAGLSEISIEDIGRGMTDPRADTPSALVGAIQGARVEFIYGGRPGVRRDEWKWCIYRYKAYGSTPEGVTHFFDFGSMLRGLPELKKEFPPPEHRLRVQGPALATEEQRKAIERVGLQIAL